MGKGQQSLQSGHELVSINNSLYFTKWYKITETLGRTRVQCTSLPLARIKIRRQAVQSWHEWGGRSHVPAAADINDAGQLSSYLQIQANGPTDTAWIHNTPATTTPAIWTFHLYHQWSGASHRHSSSLSWLPAIHLIYKPKWEISEGSETWWLCKRLSPGWSLNDK